MPWTASARRQYARPAARYATDLTDAEFALLAPHLPAPSRLGRPREVDLREVLDAILYLLRTGCPWRLLPKEFPPKSTVFGYFRRLWEDGTWPTLHALLVMAAREQAGREASPTAGIIDGEGVGLLEKRVGMHPAWANAGGGLPVGAGIPREHPMTTRVSAAYRTRELLEALIEGRLATAPERSDLVRLAARLILEEALEGEVRDRLRRGGYQ